MLGDFDSHTIDIIRNQGKPDEQIFRGIMGDITSEQGMFKVGTDIKKGDIFIVPNFPEPVIVTKVRVYNHGMESDHITGYFSPVSEFNEKKSDKLQINQTFNGEVGKVAGRDINEFNINSITLLTVLQNAIDQSEIPPEQKTSIKSSIQKIIENPYVANISSSVLMECLKSFL